MPEKPLPRPIRRKKMSCEGAWADDFKSSLLSLATFI